MKNTLLSHLPHSLSLSLSITIKYKVASKSLFSHGETSQLTTVQKKQPQYTILVPFYYSATDEDNTALVELVDLIKQERFQGLQTSNHSRCELVILLNAPKNPSVVHTMSENSSEITNTLRKKLLEKCPQLPFQLHVEYTPWRPKGKLNSAIPESSQLTPTHLKTSDTTKVKVPIENLFKAYDMNARIYSAIDRGKNVSEITQEIAHQIQINPLKIDQRSTEKSLLKKASTQKASKRLTHEEKGVISAHFEQIKKARGKLQELHFDSALIRSIETACCNGHNAVGRILLEDFA